jgi:hypothetical protein
MMFKTNRVPAFLCAVMLKKRTTPDPFSFGSGKGSGSRGQLGENTYSETTTPARAWRELKAPDAALSLLGD